MNMPNVQKSIDVLGAAMFDVLLRPWVDDKVGGIPLTCIRWAGHSWLQTASATWAAVAMRVGEFNPGASIAPFCNLLLSRPIVHIPNNGSA